MYTPQINPPDVPHAGREGADYARSWSRDRDYLNNEHIAIWEQTKSLPGWQDAPDSEKLYEMAYCSGAIILEVGVFGARSAVAELRGALRGVKDRGGTEPPPQYFGVDIDPGSMVRGAKTLEEAGLLGHAILFHGDLRRFLRTVPIVPTMVFLDGDHRYPGCWADLRLLASWLAPGTPLLCHDYSGIEGVRRAVDEWIARGAFAPMGRFAGSILLRAAGRAGAFARGLSPECFERTRTMLHGRYLSPRRPALRRDRHATPLRDLTREARNELLAPGEARAASGRGQWPYARPGGAPMPAMLPGGRPWPKISIVTPSFNQGRYIEETILSVLNQGYPNLEYIVMDGGSTDETLAILERYRDRLAHAVSERDEGQSDAINKGMKLATGQVLGWLNSDDMLAPGALAAMAMAFDRPGADMVAGVVEIYRDGRLAQKHLTSCGDGPLPLEDLLDIDNRWLGGQFFYQPEVMFTRDLWQKAGGHVRLDLYHSMDYDLWLRFAQAGANLRVIGRPIARFRAHREQKTAGKVVGGYQVELPRARAAFLKQTGRRHFAPEPRGPGRRLRVALFNDLGFAYGAGIAHRRIAQAFLAGGHEVVSLSAGRAEPFVEAGQLAAGQVVRRLADIAPDLVVIGNLHAAGLDAGLIGRIAEEFETAFLAHDLWLLTGRCAYTGGCRRYLGGCDEACACPQAYPRLEPALVRPAWEEKRRVVRDCGRLSLWANSAWALTQMREALADPPEEALVRAPVMDWIKFGLELDVLRPRDRWVCREMLGLPREAFIIMSSSSSLADERKGLAHLATALDMLGLKDALVACAGFFRKGEKSPIPGMRALGYMNDPQRLAMLYSAADLFVGPSLEEAFGQVFIEAAACGTPSIGYPVGGVPEAILDGISGRIADRVAPEALAEAIDELYADEELRDCMGAWGRLWVENNWSTVSSMHRLHRVLTETGVGPRIGLGPKIDLAVSPKGVEEPSVVSAMLPGWRALSGFGPWEGPYPEKHTPRFRWAYGPSAELIVDAEQGGPSRLLIDCRSAERGQRLRLRLGGSQGEVAAAREIGPGDHLLAFDLALRPGENRLELQFWNWRREGPRPLALMVKAITAVPMSEIAEPGRNGSAVGGSAVGGATIEPKPRAPERGAVR